MKNKIAFIILIFFILFSFLISSFNYVQAIEGTDGIEYPDIPECYKNKNFENYVILKSFSRWKLCLFSWF